MLIALLQISTLMALVGFSLFFKIKRRAKAIRIPKNHNDTSEARYAINEKGYLEEIRIDKVTSHMN